MFQLVPLLLTFLAHGAHFKFDPECANYCAFRDTQNHCHGVRFQRTKDQQWVYTKWSDSLQRCFFLKPWSFRSVTPQEVEKVCQCKSLDPLPSLPEKRLPMTEKSAQVLRDLKTQISSWVQCAPNPMTITPKDLQQHFLPEQQMSCEAMRNRGNESYAVLGDCQASGSGCSYYANTNVWAGPLCLAGNLERCADVKLGQNPETGAWYRSAFQRRFPWSEQGQPQFSRDEFLGVMSYLVATKDKAAAERWMRFVGRNQKKFLSKTGKLFSVYSICPPLGDRPSFISEDVWKKMIPDDRCEMRPSSWNLMGRVYRGIGFSDEELRKIDPKIAWRLKVFDSIDDLVTYASASTVPVTGGGSFQGSLQAITLQVLMHLGYGDRILVKSAARRIDQRSNFMSPYYHWLAEGGRATEYGVSLIKKYCPQERPLYGVLPDGSTSIAAAAYFDSAVDYFGGLSDWGVRFYPTGHECVAWIDLYLSQKI